MELSQHGFLDELLAPRRESWSSSFSSIGLNDHFYSSGWNFDLSVEENSSAWSISNPPFVGFSSTHTEAANFSADQVAYHHHHHPFINVDHHEEGALPPPPPPPPPLPPPPFPSQDHHQDYPSIVEDEEFGFLGSTTENQSCLDNLDLDLDLEAESNKATSCKLENMEQQMTSGEGLLVPGFNMGSVCGENKKTRPKKLEGQPSKNLMAERRRRKRLNDRLSMLRSIVPKISKMDRTSILGDTIDYMKELLERINKLQEEGMEEGTNGQINLLGISKELKPNEVLVRNSPKFDVERREVDTRIDICCAAKPGLLLSTVNTLEALGLEIQQCVISCFNDFSMQASCSEGDQQRTLVSSEDIKQAIFRNAGYGGRCL